MATLLIAGGSGLIGSHFIRHYRKRYEEIRLLSRTPGEKDGITSYAWDPAKGEYDPRAFANVDYIINLAGAGIADKPWTRARKALILDSREQSLNTLLVALQTTGARPRLVLSASATGYYGNRGGDWVDENSDPGDSGSFLASTTRSWERTAQQIEVAGYPLAILRIGIVLAREGGALPKLALPLKAGVANYFGDGAPYTSWIHIDDLTAMMHWLLSDIRTGIWNGVAPHPVTGKEMAQALASVKGAWLTASVPAWLLRLGMGEMSEAVLTGARVSAHKALDAGFTWQYTQVEEALRDLIS
jgi:uncharacterized protein (TIGR01777 family)